MVRHIRNWSVRLIITCGVLSVLGCASSKNSDSNDPSKLRFIETFENPRFDNTDLRRQIYDMNGDVKVDLWKFYMLKPMAKDETKMEYILVRKELDLNFDGRIDRIMYYNLKESLIREEIDTNFDGSIDRVHYYDDSMIIKTEFYQLNCNHFDIDAVGDPSNPDLVRHYRKGILTREETDAQCDGVSENITIFNAEGNISQIGDDNNGDGIVDRWIRY